MDTYLQDLYGHSLTMLTDLYQLTMAQGYWDQDRADSQAVFHHFFRECPFEGGYAVAAGMSPLAEFVEDFGFTEEDLSYLSEMEGNNGEPLFQEEFLDYLHRMELDVDIHAVEEGQLVFPHEPLLRVEGPLIQCQLLETAILNIVNFQTLIATKARRIVESANDEPVLEFGLRRAQGIDGGISASRAAMIGGCSGTSNVLAGKLLDVPVKGTHAHSWVCSFDSEMESFEAYAESMPNNCVFLVDTYDTLEGTKKAIEVGKKLRQEGYEMVGIRLDSGDLAWLSKKARKLLDEAGFEDAKIVASNSLDEYTIKSLKDQGATIALWGVGTNLATAKDQPALGGVYKLAATKEPGEDWKPKMKISSKIKTSIPGSLGIRRYYKDNEPIGDMIYNHHQHGSGEDHIIDPMEETRQKDLTHADQREELMRSLFKNGEMEDPEFWHAPVTTIANRGKAYYNWFHSGVKRFYNPHRYPAGLEKDLNQLRDSIIRQHKDLD